MTDPRSHIDDYIGYINEGTYGLTPDAALVAIGSDLTFEVAEVMNRVEVKGTGVQAETFAREVRGARQFKYKLGFGFRGLAYRKFIEYALGVAAGGGAMTRTLGSFSALTRKGPAGSYEYVLCNGCMADVTRIIAETGKLMRLELEGPAQFAEADIDAAFTGLQAVDLSDNVFPANPTGTVAWLGGGFTAAQAFKWGTDAAYDTKPALVEFTQVPKWTLEIRRNLFPIPGRKTGNDASQYHLSLDQAPQQAQVSLTFQVPAKVYGALLANDIELADLNDEVVYIEVPVDDTHTFDLQNGKVRQVQAKLGERAVDMLDVKIEKFSTVSW